MCVCACMHTFVYLSVVPTESRRDIQILVAIIAGTWEINKVCAGN